MRPCSRVLLLNPRRGYTSSEFGLGYQTPLGLVFVGGPLLDAGFKVELLDADAARLSLAEMVRRVADFRPDVVGVSHTGSTAAHVEVVKAIKALKQRMPDVSIAYGGVYPTFAFRTVMADVPEIDFIVRGEGERATSELMAALRDGGDLSKIDSLVWREEGQLRINKAAAPITDLDRYRPAWELVDWDLYSLLGQKSSGVQFARGCPNGCGFCGQWMFWKRYRHRTPDVFIEQIKTLVLDYGIEHIWPADEHFTADRPALEQVLNGLVEKGLRPSMSINATVDSIIRDRDILPLYKKAGIDFVALGVESDRDDVVAGFGKTSFEMACEAVELLKRHHILACVNVIFGLEDESWSTLWRKYWRLVKLDADFVNATYLTPHFWTPVGAKVPLDSIIQPDPAKWGYRSQIVHTPNLSPRQLFTAVKVIELCIHTRPRRVWRSIFPGDRVIGRMGRRGLTRALVVWLIEGFRDFPRTSTIRPGEFRDYPEVVRMLMPRSK